MPGNRLVPGMAASSYFNNIELAVMVGATGIEPVTPPV
jgi:hypothetical protein